MIDFIRVHYKDKARLESYVRSKENFPEYFLNIEGHTGEIIYPCKAKVHNMDISIAENSAHIKNSLHKLYNLITKDENQNYNDFTYSQICSTIDFLDSKIIDAGISPLTQFEFGLNINVPIPAEIIVEDMVLMHKYRCFSHNRTFKGKGKLKQFDHHNYLIKIYDKAKHYDQPSNILRFEVRFTSKKEFQKLGIYTISDFKSKSNLRRLFLYLLKRFDELQIIQGIPEDDIELNDVIKLNRYTSSYYWEQTVKHLNRKLIKTRREEFQKLLIKHNLIHIKERIRVSLINKFIYLMNN